MAIKLAKRFGGEVISADSRQIYKHIPNFSGAVLPNEMGGVKHHLLSFLNEDEKFSVQDFSHKSEKIIEKLNNKGEIIWVVGGTSFYLESIIYKNFFPEVGPDFKFRAEKEKKSVEELFQELKDFDSERAKKIDKKNKVRIIRALEIIKEMGGVPELKKELRGDREILFLWLWRPIDKQRELIEKNIERRIKNGLLEDGEKLEKYLKSLNWNEDKIKERFWKIGQGFKFYFDLKERKINLNDFKERLYFEEGKYAKKQNTYLKKLFHNLPEEVEKHKIDLSLGNFNEEVLKKFIANI